MGNKFQQVLLMSDFDNTILNTETARRNNLPVPDISDRNIEAIRYFIQEGGRFSVATGRGVTFFQEYVEKLPMNAPCVVFNGAAIYDYATSRYLEVLQLPEKVLRQLPEIYRRFPSVAIEVYDTEGVYVFQSNLYSRQHHSVSKAEVKEVQAISEFPTSALKVIFDQNTEILSEIKAWILEQEWSRDCEVVFSDKTLLEMTISGTDKGQMVRQLAEILEIPGEHIYCVGDADNDISMLRIAKEGFAPDNCFPAVRESGATIVADCDHDAIAEIIGILDKRY
ncbi:MAG: HAD-IIB family hydrolase [Lachnospiraceae bacterium]|nr:HAD-IIB family hydrolase [Lachnospiraceae bacterium]